MTTMNGQHTHERRRIAVPGMLLAAAALGAGFFAMSCAKGTAESLMTAAQAISGFALVIDGDTVVVAGTTVRLKGVDAAELGTARGEDARRAMLKLVTGPLSCRLTGEKTHGREVGYCFTSDGVDINQAINRPRCGARVPTLRRPLCALRAGSRASSLLKNLARAKEW